VYKGAINLSKDLNDMYALIKAFDAANITGKYYMVGDEPPKKADKQHEMWNTMRKSPFVTVVPIAETEQITDYLEEHNVRPYREPVVSE